VDELAPGVDGRQPKAELVGEVVARAARAVTLDERRGAEVFQTRAGTCQRLTATIRTGTRVLPSPAIAHLLRTNQHITSKP